MRMIMTVNQEFDVTGQDILYEAHPVLCGNRCRGKQRNMTTA